VASVRPVHCTKPGSGTNAVAYTQRLVSSKREIIKRRDRSPGELMRWCVGLVARGGGGREG
jgi:hypothetical protein